MKNEKCANCPRGKKTERDLESLDLVRKIQHGSASLVMDDYHAHAVVELLQNIGYIDTDQDDPVQLVRQAINDGFDSLDETEKEIKEKFENDSATCVGALTLRATAGSTNYEVVICRSPHQLENEDNIEPVIVNRTSV